MTGTVITSPWFGTMYLSDPTTQNPATVATGIYVYGVTVKAGTSWTLANQGTIHNIRLSSGGFVENLLGATIIGQAGVYNDVGTIINAGTMGGATLQAGGTLINQQNAVLGAIGAFVGGGSGPVAVYNAGVIATSVSLGSGGSVTNAASGVLDSGLFIHGAAAAVLNAGTILQSAVGVEAYAGLTLTNLANATISADDFGVRALSISSTVDNAGLIQATRTGPHVVGGAGIQLTTGAVTNQATGTIAGYGYGVWVAGAYGIGSPGAMVTNQGIITSSGGTGVSIAGGMVSNASGATIYGAQNGIIGRVGTVTVSNDGIVTAGTGHGIYLKAGGMVTNTGTVTGANLDAIYVNGGGTIVNQGLITDAGTVVYGVKLRGGGSITNAAGGTISAYNAVYGRFDPITLDNAGLIASTNPTGFGFAVRLGNNGSRLIDEPGARFIGSVQATGYLSPSTGATATIELAAGAGIGTISGLGTQFTGFGVVQVDTSANWVMTGSNALYAVSTLTNQGTLKLTAATFTDPGLLLNNGVLSIDPSSVTLGTLGGSGVIQIGDASTLVVQGSVAAGGTIAFTGTAAVLELDSPGDFHGVIDGFGTNAAIGFGAGTAITGGTILSGNTLQLTVSGGGMIDLQLDPLQVFATDTVAVGAGGVSLACFREGTRILTACGEVPVERLQAGDNVVTASDPAEAMGTIRWAGWRSVDCRHHPKPRSVWPIRIRRGAFGAAEPARDLWLSPNHAVFVDGALIQIRCLVNGTSIVQEPVDRIVYYHIELDRHDIVLADGLPCESYLDTGDRSDFANGGTAIRLHPDFAAWVREAEACAPLVFHGPLFDRLVSRLRRRARQAGRNRRALATGPAQLAAQR